jgi:hypothetical protein
MCVSRIARIQRNTLRSLLALCETWKLDEMKYLFDESHPDHKEADQILKQLPDERALWQGHLKELQQIAAVAKSHQEDLAGVISKISGARSDAAKVVAAAVLSQIVFQQSLYRSQGVLGATVQAGIKHAASLGLSLGDMPAKLRTFVEGLVRDNPSEASAKSSADAGRTASSEKRSQSEEKGKEAAETTEDKKSRKKAKKEPKEKSEKASKSAKGKSNEQPDESARKTKAKVKEVSVCFWLWLCDYVLCLFTT